MARLRTGDMIKIVAGADKGTTGKIVAMLPRKNAALVEGVGTRTRNVKPSQLNPRGGKKDIHVAVDLSKLALVVDEKAGTTSRVGYSNKADGSKVRLARQAKNKEIK